MLCETCRWTGRPGFVRAPGSVQDDPRAMIPCPDCAGKESLIAVTAFAYRPDLEPMTDAKHLLR